MKSTPYLLWLVAFSCACTLFFGCRKGDTGPAGPAGATGPAGPQGPKGDSTGGNLTYSAWMDLKFLPDTVHVGTAIDTLGFYVDIDAPKLSADIIDKGEVKVYINLSTAATPQIAPLPYFDIYTNISITAQFSEKTISLYANADVGTQTVGANKLYQYRYIFVPGTTTASSQPRPDWNNYNSVKDLFHLTN